MGFISKEVSWQGNTQIRRYYFMGIPFFAKEKGEKQTCWLFGVRLFSRGRRKKGSSLSARADFALILRKEVGAKEKAVLWFDHSLGGGTEIYSRSYFREVLKTTCVVYMQSFPKFGVFKISLPTSDSGQCLLFESLEETFDFITATIQLDEIAVNNLVGHPNSLAVLEQVIRIKKELIPNLHVSFRGHNFQSVCPSYNLLNPEMCFCNLSHPIGCEHCLSSVHLGRNAEEDMLLMSGATTLESWRCVWGRFLMIPWMSLLPFRRKLLGYFQSIPSIGGKNTHRATSGFSPEESESARSFRYQYRYSG